MDDTDILAARERAATGTVPWDVDAAVRDARLTVAKKRAERTAQRRMVAVAIVTALSVLALLAYALWVRR